MSSESSIYLGSRTITGSVNSLGPELPSTVVRLTVGDLSLGTGDPSTRTGFILYVKDDRLLEASLLFHKIAQDLAALLPDADAGYRPDASDDHARCSGCGGLLVHNTGCPDVDAHTTGCNQCGAKVNLGAFGLCGKCSNPPHHAPGTIPIEEAAEHVEPPHRWG